MIIWWEVLVLFGLGAGISSIGAMWAFRRLRLELPLLGVFDGADLLILLVVLVGLPSLYLVLPVFVVTGLLLLGIISPLSMGLRALLPRWLAWGIILILVAALMGTASFEQQGSQVAFVLHTIAQDVLLIPVVVVAATLYAQGGLRLRVLKWGLLVLAIYDAAFMWVIPLTPLLLAHLATTALTPLFGVPLGHGAISMGIGDLLACATFCAVSYKSYGRQGGIIASALVLACGVLLPTGIWWWASRTVPAHPVLLPLQIVFGPAAFLASCLLNRRGAERPMVSWLASGDTAERAHQIGGVFDDIP